MKNNILYGIIGIIVVYFLFFKKKGIVNLFPVPITVGDVTFYPDKVYYVRNSEGEFSVVNINDITMESVIYAEIADEYKVIFDKGNLRG